MPIYKKQKEISADDPNLGKWMSREFDIDSIENEVSKYYLLLLKK